MSAQERETEVSSALEGGMGALASAEWDSAHKPSRKEMIRVVVIAAICAGLLTSAVSIFVSSYALSSAAATRADQQADRKTSETNRELAQKAYEAAQAANGALTQRGQAPVPLPPPDDGDPTDNIVAAATARVLASLPPTPPPTPEAIASAVANHLMLNPPPGPTPAAILTSVASYLSANPPPAGPTGERGTPGTDGQPGRDGEPGPPPTEQQLQDAFVAFVKANPDFLPAQLCANYGQDFSEAKDLLAADGRQFTLYGCITEVKTPTPAPTTTETSGG